LLFLDIFFDVLNPYRNSYRALEAIEKMKKAAPEGGSSIEGGAASIELLNEAPGTVILEDCR
jgi:hypothetical protein